LSSLECQALIDASPPDRAIVYRTLALTGLRRGEAKRLRIGDVHLDAANPYIELPPSITKSGQPEAIPLVPQLAAALRAVKDECEPGDPLFLRIPSMERFREDLRAAGIEETDARGRRVVLHSLRHALATMLAISRVPMAVAQRILRHRDIRLTAQVYTDEGLLPLSAAMEVLPDLSPSATARWPSARADQRAG
jgi:integrase